MNVKLIRCVSVFGMLIPITLNAQIFSIENSTVHVNTGAIVQCNGGLSVNNGSTLTNNGTIRITKNSTFPNPGNYTNDIGSTTNGNGSYYVEQDWKNNAVFNAGSSNVYLYGNTEQFVTSDNGTITEFCGLILQGNGVATNRRKTLQAVDARISTTGSLSLNNRELNTQTNEMIVLNPSPNAISNDQTFGAEGFVSSVDPGYLNWSTNSTSQYLFPVGSSIGTTRYRPIFLNPLSTNPTTYNARLNNTTADSYGFFLSQHEPSIEIANDLFFHSIIRSSGSANADINISYLSAQDGTWSSIAQWDAVAAEWENTNNNVPSIFSNFDVLSLSNWDFSNPLHPYVLATTEDQLIIPNVFTPNQDGFNDVYQISDRKSVV